MNRWQFTSLAEDDLFTIWAYIHKDNAEAADRIESAIYAACDLLASNPLAGHVRADLIAAAGAFLECAALAK